MHDTFEHLEQKERIVALWRSTALSMQQIGELCGVSKNSVAGVVHRANVSREVERVILDPKDLTLRRQAVERVEAGENIRHVAYEFNVPASTVKAWIRYGGGKRTETEVEKMKRDAYNARKKEERRRRREARKLAAAINSTKPKPKVVKAEPILPPPPKREYRATLFGLRRGMCRDVQESNVYGGRYCGEPVRQGSSYCPAHYQMYYIRSTFVEKKRTNYAMRQPALEPA